MHIDRHRILQMLPHRDPILLVDSAQISQPGRQGRVQARLPAAAALLGSIGSADVLHELVLEAAAQSVGVVIGSGFAAASEGRDERHLLLGFDDVRFDADAVADAIEITVDVDEAGAAACSARFSVDQGGRAIAGGRVMVMRAPA